MGNLQDKLHGAFTRQVTWSIYKISYVKRLQGKLHGDGYMVKLRDCIT